MDTIIKISEKSLLPIEKCLWQEDETPLAKRGISFGWLYDFIAKIYTASGVMWKKYYEQQYASFYRDLGPMPDSPQDPEVNFRTREFVDKIVIPLTKIIEAPLYARVPPEHRGSPSIFISHTWDSHIVRGAHGSLDMIARHNKDSYVWIDFICYNQHIVRNESIASDMSTIIASIGDIAFLLTTEPFFKRSWCLWELVCAHLSNVHINIYDQTDRIKYKFWSSEVNEMPPKFTSISDLIATKEADQDRIFELLISTFGSVESADYYIQNLLSKDHRK